MNKPIPLREFNSVHSANWRHYHVLALQQINGAIAQISRAESCKPGCTQDALMHLNAAKAHLEWHGPKMETKANDLDGWR